MNIDRPGEGATFRQEALDAIRQVEWHPKESVNRITTMVANRPDWCVSRQRSWGVGIPAFYCRSCEEPILTPESVAAVANLVRAESSDAWYARSPEEVLPAGFVCPHCGAGAGDLRKETDVLDVWSTPALPTGPCWRTPSTGRICIGRRRFTWRAATSIGDGSTRR